MKKIAVLFFLVPLFCVAQQQTFDVTTYTAPKGWEKKVVEGAVQFSKEEAAKGEYCIIMLFKSIPGTADAKANFDAAWETIVKEAVTVTATPEMQPPATENGWEAQSGFAPYENEGSKGIALLVTSSGFEKMVNIFILTNSNEYEKDMTAFLESVSFKKQTTSKPVSENNLNKARPPIANTTKVSIWMNMQVNPGATDIFSDIYSNSVKPKFYVVYSNGDYYPELPPEGLAAISNTKKNNDSWGVFTMNGSKGSFKSKYENLAVEKISSTQLKKTGYSYGFYKSVSVDGLRLEGGWSSIPNWTKDPYYSQPGCRQVIYFKKDGSFDDRGAFVSNCLQPGKDPPYAPGEGTYSISNFTILLTYYDGHIVQKAFTGVADKNPAKENGVVYIGTNPFYKN